ncbi:MAG: TAT-variant-translocated molybdopterin oxidoreductase [Planctomycetaceae bacterium]
MPQTESTQPTSAGPDPRATYWRSLDELQFTPQFEEFLHREFPQAASEFPEGLSRRRWLQLMGASLSLAGVAGCRWDAEQFMPHATRTPDYIPGVPQFFATFQELRGFARGLVVRQFDGRPIKVEGNPQHPQSRGATDVFAQACILDLYDPDRAGRPRLRDGDALAQKSWDEVREALRSLGDELGDGSALRVLAGASSSPSRERLEKALLERFPQAKWVEYEPVSRQSVTQGAQLAFGKRLRPHHKFDQADVILVIDGDPFGADPDQLNHSRGWASRRAPEDGPMNRLYVVESQYGSTGTAADHREAIASSRVPQFLGELEAAVDETLGGGEATTENLFLKALSADLAEHRGKSLVYVGPRQPAAVHARVHRLNAKLENLGKTIVFSEEQGPERAPYAEAIAELAEDMRSGTAQALLVLGGNPAYDTPGDVRFAEAMEMVANTIHLSGYQNETSRLCDWYLPATHDLEQWGDGRSYDGTLSLQQPLIAPLHDGKSECELLSLLLDEEPKVGEQIVRETFAEIAGGEEQAWKKALHDGFVAESAFETVEASPQEAGDDGGSEAASLGENEYELVFCESEQVYDGRFANNSWLQEAPAYLSKITWDNAALLSATDAERLGVKIQDVVRLTLGEESVELPVYVLPGQAIGSIGVALGYGRTAAGLIGGFVDSGGEGSRQAPTVGADVYPLRTTGAMEFATGVKVEPTGKVFALATTQNHHAIDTLGQQEIEQRIPLLVREGTQDTFRDHPDFAQHTVHHPPLESLWESPDYAKEHAWGMAIDLTKCIGCNACVVACQSENNVPVVGKEQVLAGREMHWLRIDRYFRGDPKAEGSGKGGVVTVGQPVLCMHCEHAPCEQVCPVAAAVHDHEGLNLMVYNRCVGTRYCNNNCPYKVRRFNFFNYEKMPVNKKYLGLTVLQPGTEPEPEKREETQDKTQALARMVYNPEVTVRSRGVMEKCTYCTQRIQAGKIESRNESIREGKPSTHVPDGKIKTACQQTCPTDAIVFGDLLDGESRVSKLHFAPKAKGTKSHPRAYAMLSELNVRPRTAYLARIRNPHPLLADSEPYATVPVGHASEHHDSPGEHEHEEEHAEAGAGHT